MKKILLIIAITTIGIECDLNAQSIGNDYKIDEEIFTYKVKLIDEFIERFNDDKHSFIRKEIESNGNNYELTRKKLLISLFNWENTEINTEFAKEFITQVLDPKKPNYISFTDSNWYARVTCVFQHEKKEIEIPIILHIRTYGNKGSKWMITGILQNATITSETPLQETDTNRKLNSSKFIPTSNYALDFLELHRVFTDSISPINYFDESLLETTRSKQLIWLLRQNKLTFLFAKDIRFYFYQIPEWIFEVEQIERKSKNSGWLINKLYKANKKQKESYKAQLLQAEL